MPTVELAITGHRDEPVPNRFVRQEGKAEELALLLPGYGYTCDMPLFYYAENLLTERGADVLRVEYAYNRRADFGDPRGPEARRWLRDDAVAACRAALAQRPYRRLVLVGKSLGTLAMGEALAASIAGGRDTSAVWLTPLLGDPDLLRQVRDWGGRSLFVAGGADRAHDAAAQADAVAATGGSLLVVDGADHGFDIPGDPVASVRALERVVLAMREFFG